MRTPCDEALTLGWQGRTPRPPEHPNTASSSALGTSRMPSGRHDKDLVFGMDGLLRFTAAGKVREPHGFFGATYGGVDRLQGATAFSVSQLVNQNLAAQERIPGCSDFASSQGGEKGVSAQLLLRKLEQVSAIYAAPA